jgi:hypothetical protein
LLCIVGKERFRNEALVLALVWTNELFNLDKSWRFPFGGDFQTTPPWDPAITPNPNTWSISNAPYNSLF